MNLIHSMAKHRTAAEGLYSQIQRSDTGLGGGKLSFQVICKFCGVNGDLPADKHNVLHPGFIRRAAIKFAANGWLCHDQPICPNCAAQMQQGQ